MKKSIEKKYLVGFDAGSSSCRCTIFDVNGNLLSNEAVQVSLKCVKPGHFIYDAYEYRQAVYDSAKAAVKNSNVDASEIAGISFSSQRGALAMFDKEGKLIDFIFSGQDNRWFVNKEKYMASLADIGITPETFYDRLGYGMHLGTTASLAQYKKEQPEEFSKIYKVGNVQLLLTRALGSDGYYDEENDGQTTLAYSMAEHEKNEDILRALDLDPEMFSDVYPAGTPCGVVTKEVAEATGFVEGTPVFVGTGDQMCNDIGAGCVRNGMSSLCMGTIGVLDILSEQRITDTNRMLSINSTPAGGYIVQGMCGACGGSYKWLRENLCEIEEQKAGKNNQSTFELMNERAAKSKAGANGLLYQPFLGGAFTYGDYMARGSFVGLNYGHTKDDMVRAVMEGVAYELRHGLDELIRVSGQKPEEIRVTGGGRKSKLWMQIIADVLNTRLVCVGSLEAGTLGAAMIAGVGTGIFENLEDAAEHMVRLTEVFEPNEDNIPVYEEMQRVFEACYEGLSKSGYNELIQIQIQG